MLLLRTEKLPEGPDVQYEIKFDGYRALAMKSGGKVQLRSRNDNDFNVRYPGIVKALAPMPDETVIDGEVVALDSDGKPSFNTLQNYGSAGAPLHFYIFDLLILKGRDVMDEPLVKLRELLEEHILPKVPEPIRYSPVLEAKLEDLIRSVKAQGLEGLVAKRRQQVRAWPKIRRVAENACQPRPGIRHRRLYALTEELRCAGHWLLRRIEAHVRSTHAERVHTSVTRRAFQEAQAAGDLRVPFREPAGEEGPGGGEPVLRRQRWRGAGG